MKTKVIADIRNDVRQSCWTLIQNDDRTLHVQQEVEYRDGGRQKRVLPINEFLIEGGPPPRWLHELIARMFDDP